MTKKDLALRMSIASQLPEQECEKYLEAAIKALKTSFIEGHDVFIRGFGTFANVTTKEKVGRDITRKKSVVIPPRRVIRFKASPNLKKRLTIIPD